MAVPVYDAISDRWQIFDREFKFQKKAVEWMNKVKFVRLLKACAIQLGEVMDTATDLSQRYKDLGFAVGGDKEIGDGDLKELDMTAKEVKALVKVLEDFYTFCNTPTKEGEQPNRVIINKGRD